ncbi:MAG: nicotinate (nicotinamide) nucleotide adenylyltransferase [Verrucomicrobia bacterium]|nr:nicotinate (nicotinamide) nucleotide adenylyltransferase [Verrucomicrobiota bacterium]
MKHWGFFGGTFDPIHFGHLNLAINLLEVHKLDHILFSPANFSPMKGDNLPTASSKDRLEMTKLALEGIPDFSLLDLELEREGPSYTIDTIKELLRHHSGVQFHLILGEDVLEGLPKWRHVEELLTLAPPYIGARPGAKLPKLPLPIAKWVDRGRSDIPNMEISSTELRKRLIQKKYCGHLIPTKVLDYIHAHRLY